MVEEVASMFLPNGSLLFETAGRGGEWHRRRTGAARYAFGQPVAILVDESTASAAEIVAACLRDHGRAVLVGSTTFGKASVQIPVPLADGGVLRMTSEVWRTPLGFNILGRGLKPDLEAKTPPGEEGALLLAWLEADRSPGLPVPDSDAALAAARGLLADPGRLATVLAASRTSATAVGD